MSKNRGRGGSGHSGPRTTAPARHIPWPEIFKHHISNLEGHLNMLDMVRKHTVEGTGNYRQIIGCVNRGREMLRDAKDVSRSFVEPRHQREKVPLGSSSESMFPGYKIGDIEYGKAAEEFGKAAAEARAQGIEIRHPDMDYEIGQAKGIKRRTLAEIRNAKAGIENGGQSNTGLGLDGNKAPSPTKPDPSNGFHLNSTAGEAVSEGDNPYFVIDTKPTPVNIPYKPNSSAKRTAASPQEDPSDSMRKRPKRRHSGDLPKPGTKDGIEFQDISEQVDVRLKEKEEKRRRKEEKKRKRESGSEPKASGSMNTAEATGDPERKRKKKSKHEHDSGEPAPTNAKKRSGDYEGGMEVAEGGEKKKRKKHKDKENE